MSTTDNLKQAIAPAAAKQASVAATQKPGSLADMISKDNFKNQLKLALPRQLSADRLVRIVVTECRKTPALLNCAPESFYGAVMQCAQLGLEPGSALGQAYLLPFGNGKDRYGRPNAQLIIGYRGMIDLARRSGQILSLNAYAVYENDDFHYELGLHPDIHHVPSADAQRGALTYVYAVAQLKDGGVQFEVMSRAEIEAIRGKSQSAKSSMSPWHSHFDEMAKKTVIRRLFKYLPVSAEALRAAEVDDKQEAGEALTQADVIEGAFAETGKEIPEIDVEQISDEPKVAEPA